MDKRILIVDDEENIRKLYSAELSADGFQVMTADSGEAAIQTIEEDEPDLVVLDIRMTERDGLDILGSLKKRNGELPVVLNSAYGTYKDDFNSWLADAYVVKSSDLVELKTKIRELLQV